MKKPEPALNEVARIHALQSLNILDTEAEERFDRLTRIAQRMFDVPIALVSLVDENRQWFKSCMGLPVRETPRDISFCGHTILGDEPFVIEDAAVDERFSDNPLVIGEPHIRFYAGCPLSSLSGHKLGTLCLIDRKPRQMSTADLELLKDLALMASRELAAVQLATLDELTGVSNRRGFMQLAQHSLSLCVRQAIPALLVFFDLDNFKSINDLHGHAEGDRALVTFSEQLLNELRSSDLFARLGGDEFVALLTNSSSGQADAMIERFRVSLQQFNCKSEMDYQIDFSCGVVDFDPDQHVSIEALLEEGDRLMYLCKQQSRSTDKEPQG